MSPRNVYLVGPTDNYELSKFSADLESRLCPLVEALPLKVPVTAEDLEPELRPLVETALIEELKLATARDHLTTTTVVEFQICFERPGLVGILSFNYSADVDPFQLRCTGATGWMGSSSSRPV